jgi:hypothetical protein
MKLRQIIDLFVAMGCEPQEVEGETVRAGSDWEVYYLYNPRNDRVVSLVGIDLDDSVAPTTLETWERTLDIQIPRRLN